MVRTTGFFDNRISPLLSSSEIHVKFLAPKILVQVFGNLCGNSAIEGFSLKLCFEFDLVKNETLTLRRNVFLTNYKSALSINKWNLNCYCNSNCNKKSQNIIKNCEKNSKIIFFKYFLGDWLKFDPFFNFSESCYHTNKMFHQNKMWILKKNLNQKDRGQVILISN